MSEGEFKIGKSQEGARKISQSDPSTRNFGLFYPMFSGAAVSSPRHRLVRRNSRYCVRSLLPSLLCSLPPPPSLIVPLLPSFLPSSLSPRCSRSFEFPVGERGGRVHAERQRCASRRKGKWWKRRKTREGYLIRARESFLQRVLHYPRQEIREKFEHPPR